MAQGWVRGGLTSVVQTPPSPLSSPRRTLGVVLCSIGTKRNIDEHQRHRLALQLCLRRALTQAGPAASSECSRRHLQHTPESDAFHPQKTRSRANHQASLRKPPSPLTVSDRSSFHKNDAEDDEEKTHLGAGGIPAHTTASVTGGSPADPRLKQILTGQGERPPPAPACSLGCRGDSWGRFPPVSGRRPGEEQRQRVCD